MKNPQKYQKCNSRYILGLTPPPPTFNLKHESKCVLNDTEWLETHLKLFLKSVTKTDLDPSQV